MTCEHSTLFNETEKVIDIGFLTFYGCEFMLPTQNQRESVHAYVRMHCTMPRKNVIMNLWVLGYTCTLHLCTGFQSVC